MEVPDYWLDFNPWEFPRHDVTVDVSLTPAHQLNLCLANLNCRFNSLATSRSPPTKTARPLLLGKAARSLRPSPTMSPFLDTPRPLPTTFDFGRAGHLEENSTSKSSIAETTKAQSLTSSVPRPSVPCCTPTITLSAARSSASSNSTSGLLHLYTTLYAASRNQRGHGRSSPTRLPSSLMTLTPRWL